MARRPADMFEISPTSSLAYQMPICSALLVEGLDGINIRQRLAGFNEILRKLHLAGAKSADSTARLLALQRKMKRDPVERDTAENRDKLATLYRTSIKDTETEAELSRQSMAAIFDVRKLIRKRQKQITYSLNLQSQMRRGQLMKILTDSGSTLPLFIGKWTLLLL